MRVHPSSDVKEALVRVIWKTVFNPISAVISKVERLANIAGLWARHSRVEDPPIVRAVPVTFMGHRPGQPAILNAFYCSDVAAESL